MHFLEHNTLPREDALPFFELEELLREDPLSFSEQEELLNLELSFFQHLFAAERAAGDAALACLLREMDEHLFDESLTVKWLLNRCEAPASDIYAVFKHHMKMTMHAYIEDRRIMAAMWLLWLDCLDITSICFGVGYRNYRTFARAFKRHVGCNPSVYRKRMSRRNMQRKSLQKISGLSG